MAKTIEELKEIEEKARKSEVRDKIAGLTDSQARIALYAIYNGKAFSEAIALAETYVKP